MKRHLSRVLFDSLFHSVLHGIASASSLGELFLFYVLVHFFCLFLEEIAKKLGEILRNEKENKK